MDNEKPKVIPVIISHVERIPEAISDLYRIDLSRDFGRGIDSLKSAVRSHLARYESPLPTEHRVDELALRLNRSQAEPVVVDRLSRKGPQFSLSYILLEVMDVTVKHYGGVYPAFTRQELDEEVSDIVDRLRRTAAGLIANLVRVDRREYSMGAGTFPNVNITHRVEDIQGFVVGTIQRRVTVEVGLIDPDWNKLKDLMSPTGTPRIISRVEYHFHLSQRMSELRDGYVGFLQESYRIVGIEAGTGEVEVEHPSGLILSVTCTDENVTVGVRADQPTPLGERASRFSVQEFVERLIDDT